jgi:hypothetical protein
VPMNISGRVRLRGSEFTGPPRHDRLNHPANRDGRPMTELHVLKEAARWRSRDVRYLSGSWGT